MRIPKVSMIVGSSRAESINRKLANAIVRLGADKSDFEIVKIHELPLYDLELEKDWPVSSNRFSSQVAEADGVLIVTPEHNRSLPAVLKNAIDWGSRPMSANVWRDKPVAITGAARGAIGTALVQQHVRQILSGFLGAAVMGGEAYIGGFTPELIDDDGNITVEPTRQFLQAFVDRFAVFASRFMEAD
ncbi:MAG TPA: NADPH-dependent FMN reductase [Aliidongia sp.]|nr:NADPH-dependent FMN reductase [Aliidongia sp.]